MPEWSSPWGSWLGPWFGERHAGDRLSALLDDELSADEAMRISSHVAACEQCWRELEVIREARRMVRALPPLETPAALHQQLLSIRQSTGTRPVLAVRLLSAALVSSMLLGVTAFLVGGEEPGTVSPPVNVYVVDHVTRTNSGPLLMPVDFGR